jgi:TatD DNase family protein
MLIDSHAHLEMPHYETDLEQVIQRALTAGISHIINIGSDEESSVKSVELAARYDMLYAAVGIHPHEARLVTPGTYDKLSRLAAHPKVIALGEIGLDYHYRHSPLHIQQEVFVRQLQLAHELQLPVIIHQREAGADTMNILTRNPPAYGGVMHCFSGDESMLKQCLKRGLYISVAGPVSFKKSEKLRQLISRVPAEKLLLETDSPYLTPVPYRGKRNEPAYVKYVAQLVAELKGLTLEDIGRITSLNVQQLFGIPVGDVQSKIVYPIRRSLYVNLTNRCTNDCTFCARQQSFYVKGHNLRLEHEPTAEQILQAIKQQPGSYEEIVFCGFGEPLLRLESIIQVAKQLKAQGYKIRINTNGQGNLIHQRNILPELTGLVDALSVSLNTENEQKYLELCRPQFGPGTYAAIKDFIRQAKQYIPEITVTVLDMPGIDIEQCRQIAEAELGVGFRVRAYDQVG